MNQSPLIFFSYARDDDELHNGHIVKVCQTLLKVLKAKTGQSYNSFLDVNEIAWGENFEKRIADALNQVTFFIPFVSPNFFASVWCPKELRAFLDHQQQLGRDDLILPVYYRDCKSANLAETPEKLWLKQKIDAHQYIDWQKLRGKAIDNELVTEQLETMADQLLSAINRVKADATTDHKQQKQIPMPELSGTKGDNKPDSTHTVHEKDSPSLEQSLHKNKSPTLPAIQKPDWAHSMGQDEQGLWFEVSQQGQRCRVTVPAWSSDYGFDKHGFYADFSYSGISQRCRYILPGKFFMGSPSTEPERYEDEVRHPVSISRGFWLADTACTQALWLAVMGNNPAKFNEDANNPVEQVSWDDVQEFLQDLNFLIPGLQARLPTEAQWEYACRAGTLTPFSFGSNITPEQVNYDGSEPYNNGKKGLYREKTVPVKSLPANPWGLYEMHGNVWEWCQDFYTELSREPATDPAGPDNGVNRVLRGGSWNLDARRVRSAVRRRPAPDYRIVYYGFRLALGQQAG